MKKIMMLLASMFVFTAVYAQGPTCRVDGTNEHIVATVTNPQVTSNDKGKVCPWVSITKESSTDVSVVVEAIDNNGNVAGTTVVTIYSPKTIDTETIDKLKPNTSYTLRIASACCK